MQMSMHRLGICVLEIFDTIVTVVEIIFVERNRFFWLIHALL
jgi:hypothetical protein